MAQLVNVRVLTTRETGYTIPMDVEVAGKTLVQHLERTQIYDNLEIEVDDKFFDGFFD